MPGFIEYCNQLSLIDDSAKDELCRYLETKTYRKGEYLLKDGKICNCLFFINKGLTKSYFVKEDREFIMRFFSENVLFTVFDSYLTQTPSKFMVMALEPASVTMISHTHMEELCLKYHSIETFFRKLVSIAAIKMTKRISEMLEENVTERYNQFVKENNQILQRVSLGDLAKYLGVTQQSLSRIRNQK